MKNLLVILCSLFLLSCGGSKTGIIVKRKTVLLSEMGVSLTGMNLHINQTEMKLSGSKIEDENTIVHYKEPAGNRKLDLIFKTISSHSFIQYNIFVRFADKNEWQPTDTIKLFFNTTDSIKSGIYSVLYGSVYCWTKPVQFKYFNKIGKTDGIQVAYWQFSNNTYAAAIPLGGNGFAFSLASENKGFGAIGSTGYETRITGDVPILSLAISTDFYNMISSSFQYSFEAMGIPGNLRIKKTKPDMYNYLGWASWNAFKHSVNEEKILSSAKSFKTGRIPVKWFLIDDGWLDVIDNKLNSYVPDKKKFPTEFKNLTSDLKKNYGINDVGVWHTLNGYWEGLSDSGKLLRSFNNVLTYNDRIPWLKKTVMPFHFVNPFSDEGYRFYDDWYKYLSSQGISFVKVDNQLVIKKLADRNSPFWLTGEKAFYNLHAAVKKYFNGNVINCMNMTNLDFYHYSNSTISRTVEDYNPENNPKLFSCEFNGNAAAHIIASVHNSVWLSNIMWPDYDMFQSNTKDAWYYAIAKIMSNGPVYITDEPGKHNFGLLKSITFSDGRVINSDKPALPTEDCLFQLFESEKPFKVFSTYKANGLLAAWNVSDRDSVSGSFSPASVKGLKSTVFVVFDFFSKKVFEAELNTQIPVTLKRTGCNLYSVIPLTEGKAVIGDVSKIIPMAAVSDVNVTDKSIQLTVNEKGTIWIFSKSKPLEININSKKIKEINYVNNIISVNAEVNDSHIQISF